MEVNTEYSSSYCYNMSGEKKPNPQEAFQMAKSAMEEAHKLTPDNIKHEDDWRKMSDNEWDKLVEHVDKYLDAAREEFETIKEKQEEAARKMAAEAPAGMKSIIAAQAALKVAANGFMGNVADTDTVELEKQSWTYEIETDDQVILAEAKMANEKAADMLTKSQEIALMGDTTEGISEVGTVREYARAKEDEEKKTWIITAFTDHGIMCKECTKGGESRDLWSIEYKNPGDYKKVWDFLDRFEKDSSFEFAGNRSFWIDFLAGRVSEEELDSMVEKAKTA